MSRTQQGKRRHTWNAHTVIEPLPPTGYRKVKGVGRHTSREYCERCGQKRKNCTCPK